MLTREICKGCNRENPVGFTIPDQVWAAAVPSYLREATLCVVCFDALATQRGVDWTADVVFHPVSGIAFRRFLEGALAQGALL